MPSLHLSAARRCLAAAPPRTASGAAQASCRQLLLLQSTAVPPTCCRAWCFRSRANLNPPPVPHVPHLQAGSPVSHSLNKVAGCLHHLKAGRLTTSSSWIRCSTGRQQEVQCMAQLMKQTLQGTQPTAAATAATAGAAGAALQSSLRRPSVAGAEGAGEYDGNSCVQQQVSSCWLLCSSECCHWCIRAPR